MILYETDVEPQLIKERKVAVIGYGSQGHAHALNLRDSGIDVRVALRPGSDSRARAVAEGLTVLDTPSASTWADLLMFCTPDVSMKAVYHAEVAPYLRPGQCLAFAHGFNIHYCRITAPDGVDVVLVAPKGQGHRVRAEFVRGAGLPALIAVHQDATGQAKSLAMSYAWGIGSARAGILETTFQEETETDLFGEQAVLCGGLASLVKAGFETLVEAGYRPEAAYFECLHELKLIIDLVYRGGLTQMRASISDTAEWGDYVSGDLVIGEQSRRAMKEILARIRSGEFARELIEEIESGGSRLQERRRLEANHPIEVTGRDLRSRMRFGPE